MSSMRRTLLGLWASCHPGPTGVVTALAAALSLAAGLDLGRAALLTVAVFAGQLSIGISNDALDSARDRSVGRADKPIARGDVDLSTAWTAAVGSLVLALLLSAPLGIWVLLGHTVMLASAWSYNLGLKASAFSLVPFLITFGLFPSLPTLTSPGPQAAAWWAWAAGAALGAAIHLTNVLPDLDDDARTGIRGLPHRLGGQPSAILAASGVLLGALAVALGPGGGSAGQLDGVAWVFFGLVVTLVIITVVFTAMGRSGRTLFRLVMLAALLLAVQLVASGQGLVG